jgi:hydrogenase nickel incorporation protein HypB
MTMARRIRLEKRVLSENDRLAESLASRFAEAGVFVLNLMSSPGAGKTSLLEATAAALADEFRMAAVEGDLATARDAERLRRAGMPTHQVNTGRGCHLNARQVEEGVADFDLSDLDILFIENVGNLVCPSQFDLGERRRVVVCSTPEGEDKPVKYPVVFHTADCVVLNKVDLLEATGFDRETFRGDVSRLAPDAPVLEVSCRTGEGLEAWYEWLRGGRPEALGAGGE